MHQAALAEQGYVFSKAMCLAGLYAVGVVKEQREVAEKSKAVYEESLKADLAWG